ncbi:hypothetical protein [Thermoanaerobacterium sp. RBIITD]|uniref:hypothetical protein n=1 Tax=Thermoanaerobacterium sp. RBIITD TaxID=1550240 RepID=UPI000BB8E090|nr:hypothetical protein [Thermoanaerobacterium sp. RBIITD]SNX55491.1 hypothetical protein SAMN05660242_3317 [Thermoanaerobacterium sp. RBIITD]
MTVNPIDLQVAIPKMVEISNIKQVEIQRQDIYVEQFAEMINHENDIKKSRTNKTNETAKLYIKNNKDRIKKKNYSKNNKKTLLGHIDIKI